MALLRQNLIGKRYVLEEQLGLGSMGQVFRAADRLTGNKVALKRVVGLTTNHPEQDTTGTNTRLALAQEFQTLASLRHPHVIDVLDYGFDDEGKPYFTMELLENAHTVLEAGLDRTIETRVEYIGQTLQALSYLHRRGILHRDLKPANILVTNDQVKVMDFGLAVLRERQNDGEMAGTPIYMSPEVVQGLPATEAADLYAVGVLLYELFIGHHPFSHLNMDRLLWGVLYEQPVFPEQMNIQLVTLLTRLLSKLPDMRPASASAVIDALSDATGVPLAQETADTRESYLQAASLVGRDGEMLRLQASLEMALSGRGGAVLLGGESGVGKSRLLNELRTLALVKGALVLRGQAVSDGGSPYEAWRNPLSLLALLAEPDNRSASVLKAIVPNLDQLLRRRVPQVVNLDARATQGRLFATVTELFKRYGQPIVLVLEDLHWASDEALALLEQLLRMTKNLPLLIVGSYRDDERPDLPGRLPTMSLISLKRLDRAAITALAQQILGDKGASPELVAYMERETGGNVFILTEVMRTLAEEAGGFDRIDPQALPENLPIVGLREIVARRLNRAPAFARPLLELAAVIGRQLDEPLLRAAGLGIDIDRALSASVEAGLLEADEDDWRFAHDRFREGLLAQLNIDDRIRLHRQAAELIESVYGDQSTHIPALVYHWAMAGDTDREARYALLAGDQAQLDGGYQQALAYLERALSLEPEHHTPETAVASIRVRLVLAQTLYSIGQYERARDLLTECIALAESNNQQILLAAALNTRGNIELAQGTIEAAERFFERSLEAARAAGERLEEGRTLRSLGVLYYTANNIEKSRKMLSDALIILTEFNDVMGIAAAYTNLAALAALQGNYPQARAMYEGSLGWFEATGFPWGIAYTQIMLGITLLQLGEATQAQALHQGAVAICRSIGHVWGTGYSLAKLAADENALGLYGEAQVHMIEAMKIANSISATPLLYEVLLVYGQQLNVLGDVHGEAELALFLATATHNTDAETERSVAQMVTAVKTRMTPEEFAAAEVRAAGYTLSHFVDELLRLESLLQTPKTDQDDLSRLVH